MGTATIYIGAYPVQVPYTSIGTGGYHSFLLYDSDADGDGDPLTHPENTRIIRGDDDTNYDGTRSHIVVELRDDATTSRDWRFGFFDPDPGLRAIAVGTDATAKWDTMWAFAHTLGNTYSIAPGLYDTGIAYSVLGPNSNSITTTLLDLIGLNFDETTPHDTSLPGFNLGAFRFPGHLELTDGAGDSSYTVYDNANSLTAFYKRDGYDFISVNPGAGVLVDNERDSTGLTTLSFSSVFFSQIVFSQSGNDLLLSAGHDPSSQYYIADVRNFYEARPDSATEGPQTTAFDFADLYLRLGDGADNVLSAIGVSKPAHLDGMGGDDTLLGGAGTDSLVGGAGTDTLRGNGGGDFLEGGPDADYLSGGADGDRYSIGLDQGSDTIDDQGGTGTDTIALFTGDLADTIQLGWFHVSGNDLVIEIPDGGHDAIDITIKNMGSSGGSIERLELYAGDGTGPANDTLDLAKYWADETKSDPIPAPPTPTPPTPDGPFTFIVDSNHPTYLGTGNDDVVGGSSVSDIILGIGGKDFILGQGGSDALNGGDQNDTLVDDDTSVGLYADNLLGGAGDDTLVFFGAGNGQYDDSGDGGSGTDLALVSVTNRTVDWQLSLDGSTVIVGPQHSSDERSIDLHNMETVAVLFGSGDDEANGGNETDYLDGGSGDDSLDGGRGNDSLLGGSGDDSLFASSGRDWMDGGSGHDSATIDLSSQSRDFTFLESDAQSSTGFTFEDGTFVKNVEQFDLTTGSGNDQIWFGADDITVETGAGDDELTSDGHGHEVVDGGTGSDRLVADFSWSTDRVQTQYDASSDQFTIYSGSSSSGAPDRIKATGIEEFSITGGTNNDNLHGRSGNDTLQGNGGDDNLDGSLGDDVILGGSGDDKLTSGAGVDWLDGGSGDDLLIYDHPSSQQAVFFNGALAASSAGFTFADGTYVRSIERVTIFGSSTNDSVSLAPHGYNTLNLGTGNDTVSLDFRGAGGPITSKWDGFDSFVAYTGTSFGASPDQDNVRVVFPSSSTSFTIIGSSSGDTLTGYSGNDVLIGGAGNDALDGSDGEDTASYALAPTAVVAKLPQGTVTGGDGQDTLTSIEDIVGSGYNDTLVGNGSANKLWGSDGTDRLIGGSGDDVLDGGAGSNTLEGDGGNDQIVLSAGKNDRADGGDNDDVFYLGSALGRSDRIDGGTGTDTIVLDGDYAGLQTVADTFRNIETLDLAAGHSYRLTLADGNLAAGQALTVNASELGLADAFTLNASAETDGSFSVYDGLGSNTIRTGAGNDTFVLTSGSTDVARGGAGDDTFYFAENFNRTDTIDGGLGSDTLLLNGDYSAGLVLKAKNILAVETIAVRGGHSYDLTTADDLVAAHTLLTVNGTELGSDDGLTFDGRLEHDGTFTLYGGQGRDNLTGGSGKDVLQGGGGADVLTGGAGADRLSYGSAAESTGATVDRIVGFNAAVDKIDLWFAVSGIDQGLSGPKLESLGRIATAAQLGAHHALLYTLTNGNIYLVVDANGVAGYQAGEDLVMRLDSASHLADFGMSTFG